jgi:alpha-tubulin suppressor-like RCC1 family protein
MANVVGLAAGYEHSLFLVDNASTRSCYAVGSNQQGQSAQSSPLVLSPMMVDSYTTVVEITAGPYSSMLILNGVSVKQWGQMGDGRKVNIPEVFTEL